MGNDGIHKNIMCISVAHHYDTRLSVKLWVSRAFLNGFYATKSIGPRESGQRQPWRFGAGTGMAHSFHNFLFRPQGSNRAGKSPKAEGAVGTDLSVGYFHCKLCLLEGTLR